MKDRKCINCGASLDVRPGEKCKYCGTMYVEDNSDRPVVINNYYSVDKKAGDVEDVRSNGNPYIEEETVIEKHDPEINLVLCIFLFVISPFIGGVYLLWKVLKSHKMKYDDED